ncbi:MAG TPA: 4-alpha-glucanotransferase [Planctomycetota bacterium]
MNRSSGILLHLSSLPGGHGIGDLGPGAYRWVDFLCQARQEYWQILPLNPVGFGNSPYSSHSSLARNPLFISLDALADDGLLQRSALQANWDRHRVDYDRVRTYKLEMLNKAFEAFQASSRLPDYDAFQEFNPWVREYAEFASAIEKCTPESIVFQQYAFDRQWARLKEYASRRSVRIIGDLPMYVAPDGIECQKRPELFDTKSGFVAGAPPCETFPNGQRWGNPLYQWDQHRRENFAWWLSRLRTLLRSVDVVRLDHFCGYHASWATKGSEGYWREGPRDLLFQTLRKELGDVQLIAEDLGKLIPDIQRLRGTYRLMSTKVLQFAFDGSAENPYLPDHYRSNNCVVYTGTHDNDTVRGWLQSAPDYVRDNARQKGISDNDAPWDMIRMAARSRADLVITPYQDVLGLGREARFNTPGTVSRENWSWRVQDGQLSAKVAEALAWLSNHTNRMPRIQAAATGENAA